MYPHFKKSQFILLNADFCGALKIPSLSLGCVSSSDIVPFYL